jgi:hypothetical protein
MTDHEALALIARVFLSYALIGALTIWATETIYRRLHN